MKFFVFVAFLLGSAAASAQISTGVPQQSNTPPQTPLGTESQSAKGTDSTIYKIGGSVKPPKLIHQEDAQFSAEARRKKISGEVMVQCIVDLNGLPQELKVVKSAGYGLDEQALKAVQQYRFAPATKEGQPVQVTINVSVNFQIFQKHWWTPF
jgi:TonB family protein